MSLPRIPDSCGRFNNPEPRFTSWPTKWHVLGLENIVKPGRLLSVRQWSTKEYVWITVGDVVAERIVVTRYGGATVRFVVAEFTGDTHD